MQFLSAFKTNSEKNHLQNDWSFNDEIVNRRFFFLEIFVFLLHISFKPCGVLFETSRKSYWETLGKTKFRRTQDLILLHCTHRRSNAALKNRNFLVNKYTIHAYRPRDEGERLQDTSLTSINASETSLRLFFMSYTGGFRRKSINSLLVCKFNWENKAFAANRPLLRKNKLIVFLFSLF